MGQCRQSCYSDHHAAPVERLCALTRSSKMAEQIDRSTMDSSQLAARRAEGARMERRVVMKSIAAATALVTMSAGRAEEQPSSHARQRGPGPFIMAADGT